MMLATARLAAIFSLSLAAAGCGGRASREECTNMLEHYIDLTITDDPQLARLPKDQKATVRELKRELKKGERGFRKVRDQCETKVTRGERDCAMEATSASAWETCIQ